jgi:hypothetical protein
VQISATGAPTISDQWVSSRVIAKPRDSPAFRSFCSIKAEVRRKPAPHFLDLLAIFCIDFADSS